MFRFTLWSFETVGSDSEGSGGLSMTLVVVPSVVAWVARRLPLRAAQKSKVWENRGGGEGVRWSQPSL